MGYHIKIQTPLDWMGVTDHSEYVGTLALANTPRAAHLTSCPWQRASKSAVPPTSSASIFWLANSMVDNKPVKLSLVSPEVAGTVWKENTAIAEAVQQARQVHGVLFLRVDVDAGQLEHALKRLLPEDSRQVTGTPFQLSRFSGPHRLWNWMDAQRAGGSELLAISHNPNLSDGHMFPIDVNEKGRPIDAVWAASRDRNERLTEIKQIKGQSETHPILSPNDEFANYEILTYLLGDPQGVPRWSPAAT